MLKFDKPFAPPIELKIAGGLLFLELLIVVVLSLSVDRTGISPVAVPIIAVLINCIACAYLGIAAHKLGKSWMLYGLLPALGMVMILALYSLYNLWFNAWIEWADRHASLVPENSA